jgi:AraC-like DNA-binding protein
LHRFVRRPRRTLLVLHEDRGFVSRLREGAAPLFEVRLLAGWRGLAAALERAGPAAISVVDPYHGARGNPSRLAVELRELRRAFPSAVTIAALSHREHGYQDIWTLSTWGVAEVLIVEEEGTPRAIRQLLLATRARSLRRLLASLGLPDRGRTQALVDAASEVVVAGGQAEDMARALSVSRATLLRWCGVAGLPPPRRLLLWIRLLLAASLLDDPGHSVRTVSEVCGYSSPNALRNALRALSGLSPTELRERGGLKVLGDRFRADLSEAEGRS